MDRNVIWQRDELPVKLRPFSICNRCADIVGFYQLNAALSSSRYPYRDAPCLASEVSFAVLIRDNSVGDMPGGIDEDLLNQTIGQIEFRSKQRLEAFESECKGLRRQLRNDHEKLRAIAANLTYSRRVAGLPELQTRIDAAEDRLKSIAWEQQSLKDQSIDTAEVRRLLGGFEGLWETIQPREQVRLAKLLIDRVDFDGVAGNVAITFHDTGLQSLSAGQREVTA